MCVCVGVMYLACDQVAKQNEKIGRKRRYVAEREALHDHEKKEEKKTQAGSILWTREVHAQEIVPEERKKRKKGGDPPRREGEHRHANNISPWAFEGRRTTATLDA